MCITGCSPKLMLYDLLERSEDSRYMIIETMGGVVPLHHNEYLYQGCIVSGISESEESLLALQSYRPIRKEGPYTKIRFIFSHSSCIRSYFYARDDWVHLIAPKLSTKFLKQNRQISRDEIKDGIRILTLDSDEEIPEILDKLKTDRKSSIAVLCNKVDVFNNLTKHPIPREFVIQDRWT